MIGQHYSVVTLLWPGRRRENPGRLCKMLQNYLAAQLSNFLVYDIRRFGKLFIPVNFSHIQIITKIKSLQIF